VSISAPRWSKLSPQQWAKLGAYARPFSGTGVEFQPIGGKPEETDLLLHEAGFLPRRPHWNYQNVFSPFWRLYYDLECGHRVVFQQKEVPLGPDRLVLIPDHQFFHTVGTAPKPKFWLAFSHLRRPVQGQPIPIELAPSATERSLIQDLIRLFRASKEGPNRPRIYHSSLALLHLILSRPEIVWQTDAPVNLLAVVRHIEEHYASPLYSADLARLARLSESVFRRKFQYFRHVSPAQFITEVRVREATHLLATTDLDMWEIAERTGFPNPAYFSRVFKRLIGRTPKRSRWQLREALQPRVGEPD
jgi:AraC family transcriptional regulator of arabinose operon